MTTQGRKGGDRKAVALGARGSAHLHRRHPELTAQHCSAQQLVFGAVKLNINHGYGSDCTCPQDADSWGETGLGTTQLNLVLCT